MISSILKTSFRFVQFMAGVAATLMIICGSFFVLSTFRAGTKAFPAYDLMKYKPVADDVSKPGLGDIAEINPDAVAWLTIYGTNIDYPVFQGRTDMEYINKDPYGNFSISGSIFLSVLNKKDFTEPYQLIYGHNMENGSMFGDIDEFTDEKFFYKNAGKNKGILITDEREYDLSIFAILKTDAFDQVIYSVDKTTSDFDDARGYLQSKALHSVRVGEIDHILALSTCEGGSSYGRNVLLCNASERKTHLATDCIKRQTVKRKVRLYSEKEGHLAFLNIILVLLTLCLAFPVHLLKQVYSGEYRNGNIICLFMTAISLGICIINEDFNAVMDVTDSITPAFLAISATVLMIRYSGCKERTAVSQTKT